MNCYSATIGTLRRFAAARHRHLAARRTYVFIFVPFDLSKNGHAKKAEVAQRWIDNHTDSNGARSGTIAEPTTVDRPQIRALNERTEEEDVNDEPELNFDLTWTWFLPNPLPPPRKLK